MLFLMSEIKFYCIQNDKYRGKGTTSGHPYFNCGYKNAVWVSMDMVIYTPMKKECSKLYKEGDRVVTYSMKDQRAIFATVLCTRAVQEQTGMPSVIFAGLESV